MDRISGDFYVDDNKIFNSENINFQFNNSAYRTYEVMRCTKGVLVFIDDHLERMREGTARLQKDAWFSKESAIKNLNLLIQQSDEFEGNIKLLGRLDKKDVRFAAYGIPHNYPETKLYNSGIQIRTIPIQRPNPLVKQIHVANSILERIGKDETLDIYESLLVDHENCITEGSKSNFFLIRNNCLSSAPESSILHGITRKYVLDIAAENSISVIHQKITMNDLEKYEAAFICGTSPKILPVRKVNDLQYDPAHPILKILMDSYNTIMETYILNQQTNFST
jgi:branched-chain amino acid aminotransferase